MKLLIYILLTVGIIISCQDNHTTTSLTPAQQKAKALSAAESAIVWRAKQAVRAISLDPDSVKFRSVRAGPGATACGYFNGKNSFGAYTGMQKFISSGGSVATEREAKYFKSKWNKLWKKYCVKPVVRAGNWHHVTASKLLIRDDDGNKTNDYRLRNENVQVFEVKDGMARISNDKGTKILGHGMWMSTKYLAQGYIK